MLKSLSFLLVLACVLTTPTRAYEANNTQNIKNLYPSVSETQEIKLVPLLPVPNKQYKVNPLSRDLCTLAVAKAEKEHNILPNLLQTIASVESGRYDSSAGRRVAWPWTVHANGKGHYYKTKIEAVNAVRALQNKGITNIDVGCMQVNLKYHGTAFKSLAEAFDPEKNVAYSASFLKTIFARTKSWKKTAMHYHSKNHQKGLNYKKRLETHYAQYINPAKSVPLF